MLAQTHDVSPMCLMDKQRVPQPMPCDPCRRRKIKCTYGTPCERCTSSSLHCTYATVRKKRGPKKGRGAVVEQIRRQQAVSTPGTPDGASVSATGVTSMPLQSPIAPDHLISPGTDLSRPWTTQPTSAPLPTTEWSQPGDTYDGTYFAFDEFAQNILSSAAYPLPNILTPATWAPASGSILSGSSDLTPFDNTNYASPLSQFHTPSFSLGVTHTLENSELAEKAMDLYFSHMYPIYPIVEQSKIKALLHDPSAASKSESCLIWAICALSIMHVDQWPGLNTEQRVSSSRNFIKYCLSARLNMDFVEAATYYDVLTSLFIAISLFEMKQRKASWFHVREAISLAFAAGLHRVDQDTSLDYDERIRRMRAYALLFITERGACVLDEFPVSIVAMPDLRCHTCAGEDVAISSGLQGLYNLFSMLDFNFVRLWNDPARFASVDKGFPELSALQDHLKQPMDLQGVSDIQRADVLVTQQWLRLIFWQAALRQGLVSTSAAHQAFTYEYPLEIASCLCDIVKSLPPIAIQVHGLGIFEKQFEVAYSLLDTLTYSSTAQPIEHHENLRYLLLSLSASPSSRQIYVRTLEKKMGNGTGPRKYRSLAGVQLLRDDSNSRSNSRRQSIATGTQSRR